MFSRCIRQKVHPATWAVLGAFKTKQGMMGGHRGTAFAVDSEGHLLTCWHVAYTDETFTKELDEFAVIQPEVSQQPVPAKMIAKLKDCDLALLKVENTKTRPVQLIDNVVPFGRSCAAFGHPLSVTDPATGAMRIFSRSASGGVSMPFVEPRFQGTRPVRLYELDFFTHGGSSGGPVFLSNGQVFGVVSGSRLLPDASAKPTRSNLSLAIDIREAIEFLKPLNIKLQTSRGPWW